MYCRKCGKEIKGTEKYCPNCGQDLSRRKHPKCIARICVTLFLMICAGVLIWKFNMVNDEYRDARNTVEKFLEKYKSKDGSAGEYLSEKTTITYEGVQENLAEDIEYKLGKIKKKDNTFYVSVKIKNKAFEEAFEKVIQDLGEEAEQEQIVERLKSELESDEAKKIEFTVDVPIILEDGKYRICMTSELSNALLGGYNEYISEVIAEGYR